MVISSILFILSGAISLIYKLNMKNYETSLVLSANSTLLLPAKFVPNKIKISYISDSIRVYEPKAYEYATLPFVSKTNYIQFTFNPYKDYERDLGIFQSHAKISFDSLTCACLQKDCNELQFFEVETLSTTE